jgi:hypothetical protein
MRVSKSKAYRRVQLVRQKNQLKQEEKQKNDPNYKRLVDRKIDENGIGKKDFKQKHKHASAIQNKKKIPHRRGR